MRLEAVCTLRCDRRRVWDALHDPVSLRRAIPGCRSVERLSPTCFDVGARLALGPLSMPFAGTVDVETSDPPRRMVLRGTGNCGRLAAASGRAWISLQDARGGCRLEAIVEVVPRGWLASLGSAVLAHIAERLFARFAAALAAQLETIAGGAAREPLMPDSTGYEEAPNIGFGTRFDDERNRP